MRRKNANRIKRGQTIVAERERAESESERMRTRKKIRRRRTTSILAVLSMMAVLVVLGYMGVESVLKEKMTAEKEVEPKYRVTAEIVDEDGRGQISTRVKEYIGQLEQDFHDLGYVVRRVTLPTDTSRELFVDLEGVKPYFKINMDRGTAVSAEDAMRMMKYLQEKDLNPDYVDVRVEGKAYYK